MESLRKARNTVIPPNFLQDLYKLEYGKHKEWISLCKEQLCNNIDPTPLKHGRNPLVNIFKSIY